MSTVKIDRVSVQCPQCESHHIDRVHRKWWEKLLSKKKKYFCHSCRQTFKI